MCEYFIFDIETINALYAIANRMGDGNRFKLESGIDERRDLANRMFVLLSRGEVMPEPEPDELPAPPDEINIDPSMLSNTLSSCEPGMVQFYLQHEFDEEGDTLIVPAEDVSQGTTVQQWLANTVPICDRKTQERYDWLGYVRESMTCKDGTVLSVQASKSHYCTPRGNEGPWTQVEVHNVQAMPGTPPVPASWDQFGDDDGGPFCYLPIEFVEAFIEAHGGIES